MANTSITMDNLRQIIRLDIPEHVDPLNGV